MAFVDLIFGINPAGTMIAAMRLDVLTREEIQFPSIATEYPVEDGSPISDAILPGAPKLTIAGSVSASSATVLGGMLTGDMAIGRSKLLNAIDALRTVYTEHTPVIVVTGLGVYTDMAMAGCRLSRASGLQGGNWLDVQADFVSIRKVVLKTAQVPAADPSVSGKTGATKAAAGKVAPTAPTAPVAAKVAPSLLKMGKTGIQTRLGL